MGFCVPTNVIPIWMLVLVGLVVLVLEREGWGVGGSIFGSVTVKVDTIFFHFCSSRTRKLASDESFI